MKCSASLLCCSLALGFPSLISTSFLHPRVPQSPDAGSNITSYNITSYNSTSADNSTADFNISTSSPPGTDCPNAAPLSTSVTYPFILTANSNSTNSSISLINSTLLGSTFHISDGSQSQGVFVLSPDGTLKGGLNNQVHNAGNCTLLSYGYNEFAVQFPSCAVGNTSANTDGTGVSVVNSKWMVRNICEDDESLLVLLPDFGRNASVPDHYFHSADGAEPLLFHARQDIYEHAYLVIEEVEIVDLNEPYNLVAVEDVTPN